VRSRRQLSGPMKTECNGQCPCPSAPAAPRARGRAGRELGLSTENRARMTSLQIFYAFWQRHSCLTLVWPRTGPTSMAMDSAFFGRDKPFIVLARRWHVTGVSGFAV